MLPRKNFFISLGLAVVIFFPLYNVYAAPPTSFFGTLYCQTIGSWIDDSSCVIPKTENSTPIFMAPDEEAIRTLVETHVEQILSTSSRPWSQDDLSSRAPTQLYTNYTTSPVTYISEPADLSSYVTKSFFTAQIDSLYNSVLKTSLNTISSNSSGGISNLSSFNTDDLSEGSNLYYTDVRVGQYISASSSIPHVAGNTGDVLLWSNSQWNAVSTSSLGIVGGGAYSNTDANSYIHASTTVPKTYTTNTFTAPQVFSYASTTALTVAGIGGLQLASGLTGTLQAVNGLVSASSSLSVAYGGTGATTTVDVRDNLRLMETREGLGFFAQKVQAGTAPVKIGTFGDGFAYLLSTTNALKNALQGVYTLSGYELGWPLLPSSGASKNIYSDAYHNVWLSGIYYTLPSGGILTFAANGASATHNMTDTIKAYYIKEPGAGTFKLQTSPDNSVWSDVSSPYNNIDANATLAGAVVSYSTTTKDLYIRAVGLTGTVKIIGLATYAVANPYLPNNGFIAIGGEAFARDSGTTYEQLNRVSSAVINPIIASVAPDLLIHMTAAVPTASDIDTFNSRFATAYASTSWLYLGTPMNSAVMEPSNKILRQKASQYGHAYIDLRDLWGNLDQATTSGMTQSSDLVHPTADGFKYIATYILNNTLIGSNTLHSFGSAASQFRMVQGDSNGLASAGIYQTNNANTSFNIIAPVGYSSQLTFSTLTGNGDKGFLMGGYTNFTHYLLMGSTNVGAAMGCGGQYFVSCKIGKMDAEQSSAALQVNSSDPTIAALWVNGYYSGGQTADLQRWTSTGTSISSNLAARLDVAGTFTAYGSINSATTTATSTFAAGLSVAGQMAVGTVVSPSYSNSGGSGVRTSLITVSSNLTTGGSQGISRLVTGDYSNLFMYFAGETVDNTKYIKFDFGSQKVITESKFYQQNTSSHGVWQWQGSNDNSSWSNIGSTFTLGGASTQTITTLSANNIGYRYYRILGSSGTTSSSPWIYQFDFKIDAYSYSGLTVNSPATFTALSVASVSGDALCLSASKELVVNTGAQTCTVSSARFKNGIDNLDVGLDQLNKLRPVSFYYNGSSDPRVGFLAEEVGMIDHRLIFTEPDGSTPRGVRYEDMVALVVRAVQEISKVLTILSEKVDTIYSWFKGGTFDVQGDVCVDSICITKDQFKALLIQAGGSYVTPVSTTTAQASSTVSITLPVQQQVSIVQISTSTPDNSTQATSTEQVVSSVETTDSGDTASSTLLMSASQSLESVSDDIAGTTTPAYQADNVVEATSDVTSTDSGQ